MMINVTQGSSTETVQQGIAAGAGENSVGARESQVASTSSSAMALLPCEVSSDQACCFGTPGVSDVYSWEARNMCHPCVALQDAKSDGPSSLAAQTCTVPAHVSASKSSNSVPELPLELLYLIFDQVFLDMCTSKEGAGVCALMHTCVFARARMVEMFEPVSFQKVEYWTQGVANRWQLPFIQHIDEALNRSTLDFSTQPRHLPLAFPLPSSLDQVTTKKITDPEQVSFRVELKQPYARALAGLETDDAAEWYVLKSCRRVYLESSCDYKREQGRSLRMQHASQALERTLSAAEPVLRRLRPYSRALRGTHLAPYKGTEFEVGSSIYNSAKVGLLYTDHWNIVTTGSDKRKSELTPS